MANLFNADNAPTEEPEEFVIGDFVQWKRTDLSTDYPNTTHTMAYVARIRAGGTSEIIVNGTNSNKDYLFTITSAVSATYDVGKYHWQLEVVETASGNRIVVETGEWEIRPDLDVNNSDPRSHTEIMLDKIETVLQGRADADVLSYSINGRSLSKMSPDELVQWRNYYRKELAMHKRKELIKKGKPTGATISVRF